MHLIIINDDLLISPEKKYDIFLNSLYKIEYVDVHSTCIQLHPNNKCYVESSLTDFDEWCAKGLWGEGVFSMQT